MIKACIFDLDGTLSYTLDSMACVANEVMQSFGLRTLPVENFRYYCGEGADMLIRRCLKDAGDSELVHFEEARNIYREKFDMNPLYKVAHYPGMPETVTELKKRGVKLAVCSNKPHAAAGKVVEKMFGDIFDIVLGQSPAIRRKPAPDAPLKAAEQFGVKPEECMYIGDTGTDMQTGKAAGMFTVGVLWGYRDKEELTENGADCFAEKPEEILKLYEEKRMIKLIASDLDGTLLLNGAQKLPKELFPLIHKLREMGILFVAASGRQYANMKGLFAPVLSDMAFICENGAMAVQDDKILYQDAFETSLMMDILKAAYEKEGAEFSCSTKDFYYIRPKTRHYQDLMTKVITCENKIIESFDEITEPCIKVAVYEKEGVTEESIRYWQERFSDRCRVVTSGFAWIDFIPFDTNKAKGVRRFQEMYNISADECLVFGDEYNDVEMLKAVKYGFAMSHSKPGIRAIAPYETPRVEPVLEKLIAAGGRIEEVI